MSATNQTIATLAKSVTATPQLPVSVEEAYRQKCVELKKRLVECEDSNELLVVRNQRLRRGIQRLRLERAMILREIEDRIEQRVEDSDGSPSPPPTPNEKPMRIKRIRKDTGPHGQLEQHDSAPSPSRRPFENNAQSTNDTHYPIDVASSPPSFPSVNLKKVSTDRPIQPKEQSRPKNAYLLFIAQRKETSPYLDMPESDAKDKRLAREWHKLGASGQEPYFEEFKILKEQYDLEHPPASSSKNKQSSSKAKAALGELHGASRAIDDKARHARKEREYVNSSPTAGGGGGGGGSTGGGFTAVNASRQNFL